MSRRPQLFIDLLKYSIPVLAVPSLLLFAVPLQVSLLELLLSWAVFTAITALSIYVFRVGTKQKPESQPIFTMGALGVKFLLSMVYALVYFVVMKNTAAEFIVLFFLLYLAFTIYLLRLIVKILKIKSLK